MKITSVYANNVGIGSTMTDIRLIFTEVGQEFPEMGALSPDPVSIIKANIVIPPAQAVALIQGLTTVLQQLQAHQRAQEELAKAQKPKNTVKV